MTSRTIRYGFFALALVAAGFGSYHFTTRAQATDAQNVAATTPAAGAAASKPLKDSIKENAVYATVDGQKLTGKEIKAFISKLPPQLQAAEADKLLELVVNQIVNDRLVAKEAASQKILDDAETKKRVSEATEQIIRDRFVEKALDGKITDAAVKAKYEEIVKTLPEQEEVKASHILVGDEKTAKEVLEKLKKGESFEKLAKQYSIDPTKDNGGDLGYFVQSAMVKEFGDAVFAMKKGDVSKEAVKTQFGYHVIKVVDRRKQAKPTLEQVEERVRAQLADEQIRKLVEDLRAKSKVEITIPKS